MGNNVQRRFDSQLRQVFQLDAWISQPKELELDQISLVHDITGGGTAISERFHQTQEVLNNAGTHYYGIRGDVQGTTRADVLTRDLDTWMVLHSLSLRCQSSTNAFITSVRMAEALQDEGFEIYYNQLEGGHQALSHQAVDFDNGMGFKVKAGPRMPIVAPPGFDVVVTAFSGGAAASYHISAAGLLVPSGSALPFA